MRTAGCSPSPTGALPGIGTTLTAMLFYSGCAALAHTGESRVSRLRVGHLRQIAEDHIRQSRRRCGLLAPVLPRHLDDRQDRPADKPARPAGRWPLPTALLKAQPGRGRPTAPECTHFERRVRRRVGQPTALAEGPASVSRLTSYRCAVSGTLGQTGSRLPRPAGNARPQISPDTQYRESPGGTSAATFVPDAPGRIGVPSP